MTPKQRLDQLEPIVADVARKTDRLIEVTGQTFDIATRSLYNSEEALNMSRQAHDTSKEALDISKQALDISKQALDIATKSLESSVKNEVSIGRVAVGLANLTTATQANSEQMTTALASLTTATQANFERLATSLTTATQANFERMQQDVDGLKEGQSRSEQTQQEILKLLRNMQ